jgi:hypothetical protein
MSAVVADRNRDRPLIALRFGRSRTDGGLRSARLPTNFLSRQPCSLRSFDASKRADLDRLFTAVQSVFSTIAGVCAAA